jgi:pimeloyl-ACP methyl ester carboxylesterase
LNLPQQPRPPYPYISRDITYSDHGITFGATLTLPDTLQPHPAVILISGTGKQDRDATMAGHKMFAIIADHLTRQGIIVLRVDDRGTGSTTGDYDTSTTKDFAADVMTGIAYLKTLPVTKIGLIGHSEGGAVATMVAAQSKDVAFMISLAGLASKGIDGLLWQNQELVKVAPITDERKARFNSINKVMFETVYNNVDAPDLEQKIRAAYAAWVKSYPVSETEKSFKGGNFFYPLEGFIRTATGKWYREHIRYDPAPYLEKIKVPILALNGTKDIFVDPVANLANFKKFAHGSVIAVTIEGVNHLFQHCQTCTPDESSWLIESFAPEALKLMDDWLKVQLP